MRMGENMRCTNFFDAFYNSRDKDLFDKLTKMKYNNYNNI